MSESLPQPGSALIQPVETVPAPPSESMPLEQKKEIYNTFSNDEYGLANLARDIDRQQLGGWEHRADIERLEGETGKNLSGNVQLPEYYQQLVEAATVGPDSECEQTWGAITEERVATSLFNLAKGYRYVKSKGILSAYTLPRSGATGVRRNHGSWADKREEEKEPPLDAVRQPIPLQAEDVEQLIASPEEEQTVVLSEMLDPYRYRHDKNAPQEEITAQHNEKSQIVAILDSMQPSWEKDLLAAEAWKYFEHPDINDPDLAAHCAGLISVPEFERAVTTVGSTLAEHAPGAVVERFQASSKNALTGLAEKRLPSLPPEAAAQAMVEAKSAASDMAVTINIKLPYLTRALFDSHRLLPIGEVKRSGGNENDANRRDVESFYGFYEEAQGDFWPRPLYGSVAWGDDEKLHGPKPARQYGDCVVTIKPEVAKQRTTYTYGDSLDTKNDYYREDSTRGVMTYEEMPAAKIIFEKYDTNPNRKKNRLGAPRYIEAQILGGVETDDIESVTLPWAQATRDSYLISRIREMYPEMGIKVTMDKETAEKIDKKELEKSSQELGIEYITV